MGYCQDCKQLKRVNNGPKIVLSMDGGGIRGLFQVRLLQRIKQTFNVCLCQLFDMVVGTSMGGAVALTLAQNNKESIDQKLHAFLNHKVMDKFADKSIFDMIFDKVQFDPLYDGKGKTEVFRDQYYSGSYGELAMPCIVTGYNLKECQPHWFCNWKNDDGLHSVVTLADVTTAAPIYFPPIKIGDTWWTDGGVAAANPATGAYVIAKEYFGKDAEIKILSVGTGVYREHWNEHNLAEWGAPRWVCHGLVDLIVSAPTQAVSSMMSVLLDNNWLRLDSPDIEDIKLDDSREETILRIVNSADAVFNEKKWYIKDFLGLN